VNDSQFGVGSCQPEADEPMAQEFVDTDYELLSFRAPFVSTNYEL
jgi:hypothetical protein